MQKKHVLSYFLFGAFFVLISKGVFADVNQVTVFESNGVEGYVQIRIPAIVQASNGDLLAFAEGRKNDTGNTGNIDMLLKRSSDNGLTWGALQIIDDDLGWTIGNPSPVVSKLDPTNPGRIWLPYNKENSEVFVRYSDDHGATWSSRTNITTDVKGASWGHYANGPGHAIELTRGINAGRLVIPANHGLAANTSLLGEHLFYSDDYGQTWQTGASETATSSADLYPNENVATELVDGRVYVNARVQNGTPLSTRATAYSSDGGETYDGAFTAAPQFITPVVQNSVARFSAIDKGDSQNVLLHSGPIGSWTVRENLALRVSYDESNNWTNGKIIHSGPAAYSDLIKLDKQQFGVLYEAGDTLYDKVLFSSYTYSDLFRSSGNIDSFESDTLNSDPANPYAITQGTNYDVKVVDNSASPADPFGPTGNQSMLIEHGAGSGSPKVLYDVAPGLSGSIAFSTDLFIEEDDTGFSNEPYVELRIGDRGLNSSHNTTGDQAVRLRFWDGRNIEWDGGSGWTQLDQSIPFNSAFALTLAIDTESDTFTGKINGVPLTDNAGALSSFSFQFPQTKITGLEFVGAWAGNSNGTRFFVDNINLTSNSDSFQFDTPDSDPTGPYTITQGTNYDVKVVDNSTSPADPFGPTGNQSVMIEHEPGSGSPKILYDVAPGLSGSIAFSTDLFIEEDDTGFSNEPYVELRIGDRGLNSSHNTTGDQAVRLRFWDGRNIEWDGGSGWTQLDQSIPFNSAFALTLAIDTESDTFTAEINGVPLTDNGGAISTFDFQFPQDQITGMEFVGAWNGNSEGTRFYVDNIDIRQTPVSMNNAVPEPSSLGLICLGALFWYWRGICQRGHKVDEDNSNQIPVFGMYKMTL